MRKPPLFLVMAILMTACASTAPTKIGADTYYSSKSNTAGAFGDPSVVAGKLMAQGNEFCATKGDEFELITQQVTPARIGQGLGGASITFKCVAHAGQVRMRPDNGVTTIETITK
jgi:hypothetical protein